jgi:hypothetical protein
MKRPDFNIPVYSSDEFTWKNNRGVAYASDLVGPGKSWAGSQVWNDAADMGFYVLSARTGVKMLFTYVSDEDGYDGEIQVYSSGDFVITVIND